MEGRSLVLCVATLLAAAQSPPAHRVSRDFRPWNVLLVTLDTTRADHLGAYGSPSAQTPTLDRLAREGLVAERAEAVAPLTLPAHYSLLTGRFPFEHGVRDNGTAPDQARFPTLATLLRAHGYKTAGFVASFVLDGRWGLAKGFDVYDGAFRPGPQPTPSELRRDADEVADHALAWLDGNALSPFFLWLHFYDAHAPHHAGHAAANGYEGYDGAISFMDAQLGRVVSALEARQLLERTVIVVVGDHGESLGEHGEQTHGLFVYESVLHVPLIVYAPRAGVGGIRIREPASSVDVLPTLLDLVHVAPPPGLPGRRLTSFRSFAHNNVAVYSETMYPRNHFGWSDLKAINDGRFKFIAAPRAELYDLERDPGEQRNLYAERPSLAAALERRLVELQQLQSPSLRAHIGVADLDMRARLAALGYIAGAAPPQPDSDPLPDPKDKLDLYNLIVHGRSLSRTNGWHSANSGGLP